MAKHGRGRLLGERVSTRVLVGLVILALGAVVLKGTDHEPPQSSPTSVSTPTPKPVPKPTPKHDSLSPLAQRVDDTLASGGECLADSELDPNRAGPDATVDGTAADFTLKSPNPHGFIVRLRFIGDKVIVLGQASADVVNTRYGCDLPVINPAPPLAVQ